MRSWLASVACWFRGHDERWVRNEAAQEQWAARAAARAEFSARYPDARPEKLPRIDLGYNACARCGRRL